MKRRMILTILVMMLTARTLAQSPSVDELLIQTTGTDRVGEVGVVALDVGRTQGNGVTRPAGTAAKV